MPNKSFQPARTALLCAAVFAAVPALAAEGPVTLYANLYVDFETVKAAGSAVSSNDLPPRNRVSSNSSHLGFRGVESLGGGVSAWFQVENSVRPDSPQTTDGFASRNSAVALKGDWGDVLLGQWDSPYKNATSRLDPFGNTSIAGYSNIVGGNSTSTFANAASRQSFDRRQRNIVQYWSPEGNAISMRLAYAANEERGTCTVACNPSLYSASIAYRTDALYLVAASERHNEYANTATATTRDTGTKVAAGYTIAGHHNLSLLWEAITYRGNVAATALPKTFTAGTASEVRLKTFFVGYKGDFGRHIVRLSYGRNQNLELDGGSAPNTGARFWAAGYGYEFSKQIEVTVFYSTVANQASSRNDFAVNGILGGAVNNGASPRGLAVGMKYRF
ncbi:MAG: porin [Betaproteobacteria bacterium]|nr:porin [Betaproteobacteria bacterium]